MRAETAAAYCDEVSVEAFLRKVGSLYPPAAYGTGRGRKWDQRHLDEIQARNRGEGSSLADDL